MVVVAVVRNVEGAADVMVVVMERSWEDARDDSSSVPETQWGPDGGGMEAGTGKEIATRLPVMRLLYGVSAVMVASRALQRVVQHAEGTSRHFNGV